MNALLLAWLVAAAVAQDETTDAAQVPSSEEVPAVDTDTPYPGDLPAHPVPASQAAPRAVRSDVDEIMVYGRQEMLQARAQVIEAARAEGYTREVRGDGVTMLRHEMAWKGQIWLWDDGRVDVRRNPVRFEPIFDPKKPASWLSCVILPLCIRAGGQMVSRRRFLGYERNAMAAIEPDVRVWTEKIADYGTDAKVDELPDRLIALWEEGVPLEEGGRLADAAARKAAILAYWDSRLENDWGYRVRGTVEAFIRGVVQSSESPFTDGEIAAFNVGRRSIHPLSLVRVVTPDDDLDAP